MARCTEEDCEKPTKANGLCAMHYQRTLRAMPATLICVVCGGEFPRPYRSRSQVCSDECRAQRERDTRKASDAERVGEPCVDCGKPLDSHAALGRCPVCYRAYRRTNPEGHECSVNGCGKPRVGDGLCSTHYQRQRKGLPLILEPRECPGCGVVFTPNRDHQVHHDVKCQKRDEARRRLGIEHSVNKVCWWCDAPFKTGYYHRKCCPGECARMLKSLRDIDLKYGITADDYKAMWRKQGGVCASCKKPAREKRTRRLAVDHDHSCCPGQKSCGRCVRGLLCAGCNRSAGLHGDDPDSLRLLADYIERTRQLGLFFTP